jgi:hypothetical protein
MIDFEVINDQLQYTEKNNAEKLSVLDATGQCENLKQLSPSTGRLTLGVHTAGDGNWKDEISYLKHKSKHWSECVWAGHIQ